MLSAIKRKLDDHFEQFFEESVSDDSFESSKKSTVLENLGKPKLKKTKKKDLSPWWAADDDSDDEEPPPRTYFKKKKQNAAAIISDKSEDHIRRTPLSSCPSVVAQKPSSASISRTLDKCMKLEQKDACLDIQDDSCTSDSADNPDDMLMTNQSFLKSQRTSQPIREEDEEEHFEEMQQPKHDPVSLSIERDSLEIDESVVASGPNQTIHGIGLDTLEEQEEKEQFFAKLEKGASSTIDYSKLNKELDSTDSTQRTALIRNNEHAKTGQDENKDESKDVSGNYSEDFEDDAGANSPFINNDEKQNEDTVDYRCLKNQEEDKPGMLAKVMLLDSLDSTIDTQKLLQPIDTEPFTPQGTNDVSGTGASYGCTNSDIEALHLAYHEINQSMQGTDEQRSFLKTTDHSNHSFGLASNTNEKSLKNISTVESDIPTVEELMQHIRGDLVCDEGSEVKSVSIIRQTDFRIPQCDGRHVPSEKAPQALDYFHEYNSGERNTFSSSEQQLHYVSKTDLIAYESPTDKGLPETSKGDHHQDVPLLHQDRRDSNASIYLHSHLNNDVLDTLLGKQSNKKDKSPTSVLKKPQSQHYAYVRSSGYGKTSAHVKQLPIVTEKLLSKEIHTEMKGKSLSDGRRKGVLSATRTIRFAESKPTVPNDNRMDATDNLYQKSPPQKDFGKIDSTMQHQSVHFPRSANGINLENDSSIQSTKINDGDLNMLQRLQNVEQKLNSEHIHFETLRGDFSKKEGEFLKKIEDIKTKYEKELLQLKQENYMLQTKLHTGEEKNKKKMHLLGELKDPITDEKMQQIQKEIQEQETLLQGYQQENERLYQHVKELQIKNKENEERMFKENQSLKAGLVSLREQLNKTTMHHQHAHHDSENTKNQSFTELIAELRALQKKETNLLDEINRSKQDKQVLEVDLVKMRKERDLVKVQLTHISGERSYETKINEETHKQEINRLNKRLQWFAENQELLDKDAGRLRDAYEQIENLTSQVEKLRHETGDQSVQQQKRLKDRAADAKRIQDLERQVKEMEGIIKRRHPNSIPALMFAAAAVAETEYKSSTKSNTNAFLERRIQKLETDLESKDEEAKKSLRSMEQQFQKIKIQYESRINELEQLLAHRFINEPQKQFDNTTKVRALEQELSICKEANQIAIMNLKKEIDILHENNSFLEQKVRTKEVNFSSINKQVEEAPAKARLTRLNQELISKSKEVQELSKTVERLQKERMAMLSYKNPTDKGDSKNKYSIKIKKDVVPPDKGSTTDTERFPGTLDEKMYQPGTFADFHISDVQQERDRLKAEMRRLYLEVNEQKRKFETSMSHAEHTIQRLKEESAAQTATLKISHQMEVEKIVCQHAVDHSSSRVAELTSKMSTQEILIRHLQKQMHELQKDREALAVSHVREETLQKEVAKLLEELKEAKQCHSPGMKHFLALESKIKHMEMRHSQREQELQQIIHQTRHVAETDQIQEVDQWKKLAQQKNQELEKFRMELDAILDVLRVLQRQGVVIPVSVSNVTEVNWKA
ncbi:hypothetical protein FKM82_011046 [Ascaphus truei]